MNIEPMGRWLLIEMVALRPISAGGVHLPNSVVKGDLRLGRIVKVPEWTNPETGKKLQSPFEVGNLIVYTPDASLLSMKQTGIASHGLIPDTYAFIQAMHVISKVGGSTKKEADALEELLYAIDLDTVSEEESLTKAAEAQIAFAGG